MTINNVEAELQWLRSERDAPAVNDETRHMAESIIAKVEEHEQLKTYEQEVISLRRERDTLRRRNAELEKEREDRIRELKESKKAVDEEIAKRQEAEEKSTTATTMCTSLQEETKSLKRKLLDGDQIVKTMAIDLSASESREETYRSQLQQRRKLDTTRDTVSHNHGGSRDTGALESTANEIPN